MTTELEIPHPGGDITLHTVCCLLSTGDFHMKPEFHSAEIHMFDPLIDRLGKLPPP